MIGHLVPEALRLAVVMRCTGMRRGAAALLTWADLDLAAGEITVRPETTKGGYGGRRVPLAPALLELLEAWPREELVCGAVAPHVHKAFSRAWGLTDAPPALWRQRPTHALRKAFVTGLRARGADPDSVEFLVGHSIGAVKGAYIDPAHGLLLAEAVGKVPPLSVSLRERLRHIYGSCNG